ncbi:MAG: enoyl-CoA hydratase-related protein, partial [Psychrobacter alimentarius]
MQKETNNYKSLLVTIEQHVATVTLNRPEIRNAFNDDMIAELNDVFTHLGANDEVRVIVLAAAGKVFCAGADLNWMRAMADY